MADYHAFRPLMGQFGLSLSLTALGSEPPLISPGSRPIIARIAGLLLNADPHQPMTADVCWLTDLTFDCPNRSVDFPPDRTAGRTKRAFIPRRTRDVQRLLPREENNSTASSAGYDQSVDDWCPQPLQDGWRATRAPLTETATPPAGDSTQL